MEDAITDLPPPSRFFQEDLDNFASPAPPLPSPFLLFSDPDPKPLRPSLLIIAISPSSLSLLHHLSPKTLIGTLILPEIPLSGSSIDPFPRSGSCNIYAVDGSRFPSTVLVLLELEVAAERSRAVAKALVGPIQPGKVLILDSIRSQNFRGRISVDETLAFKLETSDQTASCDPTIRGVDFLPSGSVMDGLGAAILGECQMRRLKGTLCATWPRSGTLSAISPVKSFLREVLPGLDVAFGRVTVPSLDSDLYT